MKKFFWVLSAFFFTINTYAKDQIPIAITTETIVMIRHGEKLKGTENGQIDCQGLDRSLKLPHVLIDKFGKPAYIFAPNPSNQIAGNFGTYYYYLRPLSTIEPLAIYLNMPVNLAYGYQDSGKLANELLKSKYANYTILVAWEHEELVKIARRIYAATADGTNNPRHIPEWDDDDYDTIYVLTITRNLQTSEIQRIIFNKDSEGLNNLCDTCPTQFYHHDGEKSATDDDSKAINKKQKCRQ